MSHSQGRKEKDVLNRTLLTEGDFLLKENIDLTNCDKEPIHIPGLIQPHGMLLAVTQDMDLRIMQCSVNTSEFLGQTPEELLGKSLIEIIGAEQMDQMLLEIKRQEQDPIDLHYMNFKIDVMGEISEFYGIIHESEDLIILELEPAEASTTPTISDFEWIQSFFRKMKQTENRIEASQLAAEQLKLMLDYDRVMVYEFDEQWNGKVIAEAKEQELEPFLGHHYPASDIPKQARELYLRNWLRTIVDVNYTPVKVMSLPNSENKPLNLSLSILRSVSPLHIEYLQNMGVGATLTISLIHENKLWGMITCHHYAPKYVTHRVRNLCNFLGNFFSSELFQRQQLDDYQSEIHVKSLANHVTSIFIGNTSSSKVMEQLELEQSALLEMMNASGAAVVYHNKTALFGKTPMIDQIHDLAAWMKHRSKEYVYYSSALSLEFEGAIPYKDIASGALYLALSSDYKDYIIWFRPEVVQVVHWAGDPEKAVLKENDGVRLSPRKSFEKWKHVVQSTSLPWKSRELRSLGDLKTIILRQTENQRRQAEEESQLNARILMENEKRYLQLMELSPVAFFTISEGKIVYLNQQALKLLKAGPTEELLGKSFLNFVQQDARHSLERHMSILEHSTQLITSDEPFISTQGVEMLLELTMAHVTYGGKPSIFAIARRKIGDDEQGDFAEMTRQLKNYVNTDALTEISNRRYFTESLNKEIQQGTDQLRELSVLLLDIDNFHSYNALYGYQAADTCLQWIADVLEAFGNPKGVVLSRFEGGTFALYWAGASLEQAVELAEQIRQAVISMKIPRNPSNPEDCLTVSLGVTSFQNVQLSASDMLYQAERALMKAKQEGKNRVALIEHMN
ncbi:diguanylate cyclase domain-containing protein [Paenibacillus pini]|uniref:Phytochrome n=1 Tax=Paenibacillus pini JCM 16418 TaxID=1236976 RepID=W7Y6J4_9BACL|nr:diguanylate cyclase [Paenibacillus pini]GAF06530.1 phytochrome [Paenibacillus pini JCM 16418]